MNDHPRRTRFLFTALIITSLTLLTLDYQGNSNSPLRPLERVVASVVGPVQRAVGHGTDTITGGIHFGTGQQRRIDQLEADNAALKQELAVTDQTRAELKQLKDLTGLSDHWQQRPARVIGSSTAADEWTLVIDVGSADGVLPQSPVDTGAGLLGKVIAVGTHVATVRLLRDPTMGVAVSITRNGETGFVLGAGDKPMRLTLDSPTADVRVGDVIITRGSDKFRPYYPGIAVGTVTEISATPGSTLRVALVEPFAAPGTLEYVGVITGPGPDLPRVPLPATVTSATPANGTPSP